MNDLPKERTHETQRLPEIDRRNYRRRYHTAANACTPSRGVMITGLYSQQNWLLTTILSTPYPPAPPPKQPVLNPNYPIFGKLLRKNGYQTPYTGKWHVSIPQAPAGLEDYGFDFFTCYDPTGDNLQGTYGDEIRGYHSDSYSAGQGVDWLLNKRPTDQPWCLTVSLVNPHDREFFPAGTEFKTVTDLFKDRNVNIKGLDQMAHYPGNGPDVAWQENALKRPPTYKYPDAPPNWEDTTAIGKKPATQTFIKEFAQGIWGGIADDSSQDTATIEQYPIEMPTISISASSKCRTAIGSGASIATPKSCRSSTTTSAACSMRSMVYERCHREYSDCLCRGPWRVRGSTWHGAGQNGYRL